MLKFSRQQAVRTLTKSETFEEGMPMRKIHFVAMVFAFLAAGVGGGLFARRLYYLNAIPLPPLRPALALPRNMDRHEGEKPVAPETLVTIGNHSYVRLDLYGEPARHVPEILKVLDDFEKNHPALRVTSWQTDTDPGTDAKVAWTRGLWINHEAKN